MSELARKLFENAMLTLASRIAILLASLLLPVMGFLGTFAFNRAVSSFDELGRKVDLIREETAVKLDKFANDAAEANYNIKLAQQSQRIESLTLADHETRMRRLEEGRIRSAPQP